MDSVSNGSSNADLKAEDRVVLTFSKKRIVVERSFLMDSSQYFAAMLADDSAWQESKKRTINLDPWCRDKILIILRCLKSKNARPILKNINSFYQIINYFSITPLLNQCIDFKLGNISAENVLDELEFAEYFSVFKLRKECMRFLAANLATLIQNSKFNENLPKKLFDTLINDHQLSVVDEDAFLETIDRWCSIDGRAVHRAEFVRLIRFAHLSESAFEKCRQDELCLQIPEFRTLIETPRWSDLGENELSGRRYSRPHMHVLWVRKFMFDGEHLDLYLNLLSTDMTVNCFVNCSKGSQTDVTKKFSEEFASVMMFRTAVAYYGRQMIVFKPHTHRWLITDFRTEGLEKLLLFKNHLSTEPDLTVDFPSVLFPAAPPLIIGRKLFVLHLVYQDHIKPGTDTRSLDPEKFEDLELLVYRMNDLERPPKKSHFSMKDHSWPYEPRTLVLSSYNKFCVDGEWKMLLLQEKGVLLAFGRQPKCGPFITLPEHIWNIENTRDCCSQADILVVDNLVYVVYVRLYYHCKLTRYGNRRLEAYGNEVRGDVVVYDLVEGTLLYQTDLPWNFFHRASLERDYRYILYLRELHGEVYLSGFSENAIHEVKENDFNARGFLCRLQLTKKHLRLVPVYEDFGVQIEEYTRDDSQGWYGYQESVDTHICERASVLERHASQEKDMTRVQKLRQFTW